MNLLNAIVAAILISIVIKIFFSYLYFLEEDHKYITSNDDFINYLNEGRYDNSELCSSWKALCKEDKIFVRDLMCHEIINYKDKKPCFKKIYKSAIKQIILTSALSAILLSSSFSKSVRQNSLGYFISNVI